MIHQFDHRWATYDGRELRNVEVHEKDDPAFAALPQYWVAASEVQAKLSDRWDRTWLLGWRDITNATNERTVVAAFVPRVACGNKYPLMLPQGSAERACCLLANLNSFVLDYVARQKLGGTSLNYFVLRQLPVLPPHLYSEPTPWSSGMSLGRWIAERVAPLVVTTNDLESLGHDLGFGAALPRWDPEERLRLRAQLDAAYFHLYGLERDQVIHVMDSFPIVRRNDEASFGSYRTKAAVLDIFDQLRGGLTWS